MKCDYCGSIFQKLPEEGVCPNCGAAFEGKVVYPKPPIGVHKFDGCSIEITEEAAIVRHDAFLGDCAHENIIPFEELLVVEFRPATCIFYGNLQLRNLESIHKFIAQGSSNRPSNDYLWINFPNYRNDEFERIYKFLNACAEINQRNMNQ